MTKRKKRMGRHAGAKRILDAERHPHGGVVRLSRPEARDDALAIAREARQRLWGAPAEEIRHEEWGTVLGRLCKLGTEGGGISRDQFLAGCRYREMRADYDRVMMTRPMPSGSDLERHHGHDASDGTDPDYIRWAARIRHLHERCVLALMATMDIDAVRAIERVAVEDQHAGALVGSLRLALNAVGKVLPP
jgi:hypothetical protein